MHEITADFLDALQGDEGLIAMIDVARDLRLYGLAQDAARGNWAQNFFIGGAEYPVGGAAVDLIRAWQAAPPPLTPAPIMQIPLGKGGVMLMP